MAHFTVILGKDGAENRVMEVIEVRLKGIVNGEEIEVSQSDTYGYFANEDEVKSEMARAAAKMATNLGAATDTAADTPSA
jgi:hypothetical protein